MTVSKIPERRAQNAIEQPCVVDETDRKIIFCETELEAQQLRFNLRKWNGNNVRVENRINIEVFEFKGFEIFR